MAKEKNMINPNGLGHFHRDIVSHEHKNRYYTQVALSCGHVKEISRYSFNRYKGHATVCMTCTTAKRRKDHA
ncbi:MAG: hypothetical protein KAR20_26395 [Candidatus Heimdallarchaeota archaeon]|nr:hypothetical protein [Candidatus Heimdallarchaeota archaeon]